MIKSKDAIRLAADDLHALSTGGFRRVGDVGLSAGEDLIRRAAERARAGDADALRFLYLRYSHPVFTYVKSILRDEHAAEDITQTVFSRLSMRLQLSAGRGLVRHVDQAGRPQRGDRPHARSAPGRDRPGPRSRRLPRG